MTKPADFDIFLATQPGLEEALRDEILSCRFKGAKAVPGGAVTKGGWPEVWRANLEIRGATRILARVGSFRAVHLSELERRAHALAWRDLLRPDVPVRVEAACSKSRIYHSGAATERVARAIMEETGAPISDDAGITVMVRLDHDVATLSVDTSGEVLHKRGYKTAVNKAPMRETMAALLLRQCGFNGREPVLDPMCGSGTFVIEAAEWAAGLAPGRSRSFAFEKLATFDAAAWERIKASRAAAQPAPESRFCGSDRDAGAIRMSTENAARAGVTDWTCFRHLAVSEIETPPGPAGLVIVNPPYGGRIGERKSLVPLYRALGQTLTARFSGWRVGLVTSEPDLARATGLPFAPPGPPIAHGGIRVRLYRTGVLGE